VKLFVKYSNLCDHDTSMSWTDRRTDGRHAMTIPRYVQHCTAKTYPKYCTMSTVFTQVSQRRDTKTNLFVRHYGSALGPVFYIT